MPISRLQRKRELYAIRKLRDPEKINLSARKRYQNNTKAYCALQKKWREKIKYEVVKHYSDGKMNCRCCGECEYLFLTVDHINNNGSKERKLHKGGGHHNYRRLIKLNFPSGYQILCYNCNCGRARTHDKVCPHKNEKK